MNSKKGNEKKQMMERTEELTQKGSKKKKGRGVQLVQETKIKRAKEQRKRANGPCDRK